MDDAYFLDPFKVRRAFNAAAANFDSMAVLHAEVRQRALARLQLLRGKPDVILDLGAGLGQASRALRKSFGQAKVIALDSALEMLAVNRRQQRWLQRFPLIAADAVSLPLRNASIDWVFSNLMLQWCSSTDKIFAEVRRVLKPGGVFCFTTLGPDTLLELRQAWSNDPYTHVSAFEDMHNLGDALVRARFAEPVLDVEQFKLTYSSVQQLMGELQTTGSRNLTRGRRRTLTGRSRLQTMMREYELSQIDGRIPATVEVVYGQAWKPTNDNERHDDGIARIAVSQIVRRRV